MPDLSDRDAPISVIAMAEMRMHPKEVDRAVVLRALSMAETLRSSRNRAAVLREVTDHQKVDAAVEAAYLKVMEGMDDESRDEAREQLDGLRMMSIDPMHLVVTPRAFAMVAVMPLLSALFIVCGLFGGYVVGVVFMGLDAGIYMSSLEAAVVFRDDVLGSLLKAFVFGVLVGLIATYRGYTAAPTSAGVSSATTSTVVVGSVSILIFDYFITALWGV